MIINYMDYSFNVSIMPSQFFSTTAAPAIIFLATPPYTFIGSNDSRVLRLLSM